MILLVTYFLFPTFVRHIKDWFDGANLRDMASLATVGLVKIEEVVLLF